VLSTRCLRVWLLGPSDLCRYWPSGPSERGRYFQRPDGPKNQTGRQFCRESQGTSSDNAVGGRCSVEDGRHGRGREGAGAHVESGEQMHLQLPFRVCISTSISASSSCPHEQDHPRPMLSECAVTPWDTETRDEVPIRKPSSPPLQMTLALAKFE
jgi:hypothetical protein